MQSKSVSSLTIVIMMLIAALLMVTVTAQCSTNDDCNNGTCTEEMCQCNSGWAGNQCDLYIVPTIKLTADSKSIAEFDDQDQGVKTEVNISTNILVAITDVFGEGQAVLKAVGVIEPLVLIPIDSTQTSPFTMTYTLPATPAEYDFYVEITYDGVNSSTVVPNVVFSKVVSLPNCFDTTDSESNDICAPNGTCQVDSACKCNLGFTGDKCEIKIVQPTIKLIAGSKSIAEFDDQDQDVKTEVNISTNIFVTVTVPTVPGQAVLKAVGVSASLASIPFDPDQAPPFTATYLLSNIPATYDFYVEITYDGENSSIDVPNVVFSKVVSLPNCFDTTGAESIDTCAPNGTCQVDSACKCNLGFTGDKCQIEIAKPTVTLSSDSQDGGIHVIEDGTSLHVGTEVTVTVVLPEDTLASKHVAGVASITYEGLSEPLLSIPFDPAAESRTFTGSFTFPMTVDTYEFILKIVYDGEYADVIVDDENFELTAVATCFEIGVGGGSTTDLCAGSDIDSPLGTCQTDSTCKCIDTQTGPFCAQTITAPVVIVTYDNNDDNELGSDDIEVYPGVDFDLVITGIDSTDKYTLTGIATLTIVLSGATNNDNAIVTTYDFDSTVKSYKFEFPSEIGSSYKATLSFKYTGSDILINDIVYGIVTVTAPPRPDVEIIVPNVNNGKITFTDEYNSEVDYPSPIIMNSNDEIDLTFTSVEFATQTDITIELLYIPVVESTPIKFNTVKSTIGANASVNVVLNAPSNINSNNVFIKLTFTPQDDNLPTTTLTTVPFVVLPSCFTKPTTTGDLTDISKWTSICGSGGKCGVNGQCICNVGFTGRVCDVAASEEEQDKCSMCNAENRLAECNNDIEFTDRTTPCKCKSKYGGLQCSDANKCLIKSLDGCHYSRWNGMFQTLPDGSCATTCTCSNKWTGTTCETCGLQCKYNGGAFIKCDKCGCQEGFGGESCQCRSAVLSMVINGVNPIVKTTNGKFGNDNVFDPLDNNHAALQALKNEFARFFAQSMNIVKADSITVNFEPITAKVNDIDVDQTKIIVTTLFNCDSDNDNSTGQQRPQDQLDNDFTTLQTQWENTATLIVTNMVDSFEFPQDTSPDVSEESLTVVKGGNTMPSDEDSLDGNNAVKLHTTMVFSSAIIIAIVTLF